jgi:alginate O-acetyltransferase complex protein AlgI
MIFNLGLLGFFKYYNFFVSSWVDAFSSLGYDLSNSWSIKVILPVGISFYTFQTMSYSLDIYHRKLKPTQDFISFAAFVSFFPQLVAGPIERASNLLPQILSKHKFKYTQAVEGLRLILWGLFKKVVIADNLAPVVNDIFENYTDYSGGTLILGAIFFAFQIYGDFSGYSDMAIGISKLFGIELMSNFKFPYFSRNIGEFWRRWHISLSTWFRDYLYIPLGGSRGNQFTAIRNIFIIFLVSGFWHGANWTFLIWGGIHAFLFVPLYIVGLNRKNTNNVVADGRIFPNVKEVVQMLITFLLVTIAWVFFRAESLSHALDYIGSMSFSSPVYKSQLAYPLALLLLEWPMRRNERIPYPRIPSFIFLLVFALIILFFRYLDDGNIEFIYFQF